MTGARSSSTVSAPIQRRNDGFRVVNESVEIMLQVVSRCRVSPLHRVKLLVVPMLGDVVDVTAASYDTNTSSIIISHSNHFRCHENLYTQGAVKNIWSIERERDNVSAGAHLQRYQRTAGRRNWRWLNS